MTDTVQCADRTVVLLGLSGTDKIASLKRLFGGKLFETESSQSGEVTAFFNPSGTTFLDTPALEEFSALEIAAMVAKCCEKVKDGIDAILLVLPTKLRFSREEVAMIQGMHELFSKKILGHFIIGFSMEDPKYPREWFTHKDSKFTHEDSEDEEQHNMSEDMGLDSYLAGLKKLCEGRYFGFHIQKEDYLRSKQMILAKLFEDIINTHHGRKLNLKDISFVTVQGGHVLLANHAAREVDDGQGNCLIANAVHRVARTIVLLGLSGTDKIAALRSLFEGHLLESLQRDEITSFYFPSGTDKVAVLKRLFRISLSEIESSQSDEVTAFSNLLGATFLDTPALKELSASEIAVMVAKCCKKLKYGIDAILLVLPTKFRFSREEVATIQGLHEYFDKHFLGRFIVMSTMEDDWFMCKFNPEDAEDTGDGLDSYLAGLKKLCEGRYFGFRIQKEDYLHSKQAILANLVEDMVNTHHGRKLNLKDLFLTVQGEYVYLANHAAKDMGCNPYTVIFSILLLTYLVFRELA